MSPKFKGHNWGKLVLELLVVFLGVTGGFLFNNLGQNLQDKKTEQRYLLSFQEEVKLNIVELQDGIRDDSLWLNRANKLVNMFMNDHIPVDSALEVVGIINSFTRVSLVTNTFENITNSGSLNLISDFQLKQNIVNYYAEIEEVKVSDDFSFTLFNEYIVSFVLSELSLFKTGFINNKTVHSTRFSNAFAISISIRENRRDVYKKLLAESKSLLSKFEK